MKRIHIIGRKNSGKTTLVVELVSHLRALGHRVGTIKHTHHQHELDTPGKDSFRHREAGAEAVGILAPTMNAIFWPAPQKASCDKVSCDKAADVPRQYDQFDSLMADCDIVLVEGDQHTEATKIEVWRKELNEPPLVIGNPSIAMVVTDDPVQVHSIHSRRDLPALCARLLEMAGVAKRQCP